MVSNIKGRTKGEGIWEQDAEENIWAQDGGSNTGLVKNYITWSFIFVLLTKY